MPSTRPETLDFLERAPLRAWVTVEMDHAPEVVFEGLADTPSWPEWFTAVKAADWTSPPPHGVGSTRTVATGGVRIHEEFIAWEPGRRWAFTVTATSAPLVRAAVEVAELDELDGGRTRVTYTLAAAPRLPGLLARSLRPAIVLGLRSGMRGLARHLDHRAAATR